jgi:methylmalonyl-CoA carboxyltransferase large subunit
MQSINEKIEELRLKKEKFKLGGGSDKIEKQHQEGKLTARERLSALYDDGFYQEIYTLVENIGGSTDLEGKTIPGDGIVSSLGAINGRLVFAVSQDFTSMGGSVGKMHAWKFCEMMKKALKNGTPFISINDSGGARIQEPIDSLNGYGEIFYHNTLLSGVVPQIAIIAGPCAGGAAYSPALMDFIIMVKGTGKMFIAGPQVIKEATGEVISAEELGGALAQATYSGNIHFIAENDIDAMQLARKLLSYLPSNNTESAPYYGTGKLDITEDLELNTIVPDDPRESYDMMQILVKVFDPDSILEVQSHFAPNIICIFARLNGRTVGVVANQPMQKFGSIDIDASDKSSRFVRFCNAFNIPIITFVDVPGFLPGVEQEFGGIIRHGAKMLFSFSACTVPKISIVIRKAYGGAYLAMNARSLGADRVASWPTAEIAVMGAEGAISVLFRDKIKKAENAEEFKKELIEKYKDSFASPYPAAKSGLIDDVIEPAQTRQYLSICLESLKNKTELRPQKKHGLIPM